MAILADKYKRRAPFIAISATVCAVGLLITAYAGNGGARYFGSFLTSERLAIPHKVQRLIAWVA